MNFEFDIVVPLRKRREIVDCAYKYSDYYFDEEPLKAFRIATLYEYGSDVSIYLQIRVSPPPILRCHVAFTLTIINQKDLTRNVVRRSREVYMTKRPENCIGYSSLLTSLDMEAHQGFLVDDPHGVRMIVNIDEIPAVCKVLIVESRAFSALTDRMLVMQSQVPEEHCEVISVDRFRTVGEVVPRSANTRVWLFDTHNRIDKVVKRGEYTEALEEQTDSDVPYNGHLMLFKETFTTPEMAFQMNWTNNRPRNWKGATPRSPCDNDIFLWVKEYDPTRVSNNRFVHRGHIVVPNSTTGEDLRPMLFQSGPPFELFELDLWSESTVAGERAQRGDALPIISDLTLDKQEVANGAIICYQLNVDEPIANIMESVMQYMQTLFENPSTAETSQKIRKRCR